MKYNTKYQNTETERVATTVILRFARNRVNTRRTLMRAWRR